jgi:ketosteroid isomerase-like protein
MNSEILVAANQLANRYGHVVDNRDLDALGEIFTDDAVFDASEVGGVAYRGLPAIREFFSRSDIHPPAHHTTNVYVHERDGRIRVSSKYIVGPLEGLARTGVYEDVLRQQDGTWLICERKVFRRWPHVEAP